MNTRFQMLFFFLKESSVFVLWSCGVHLPFSSEDNQEPLASVAILGVNIVFVL